MAMNNMPIRFTDEKYVTKIELIKELNISLIDDIWSSILNYRNAYKNNLGIKTIPQIPFAVTLTEVISAKIGAFESLLSRFQEALSKLQKGSKERETFEMYAKTKLLRDVGFLEGASLPEANLKSIIAGVEPFDLPSRKLTSYLSALSYLENSTGAPVGEDLIGSYYQRLLGDEEMTVFYRVNDPVTRNMYATLRFNKEHNFAPYSMIPDCMDELVYFLRNETFDPLIRAFAALYYIDYVKPFNSHNETVAALLAKNILANSFYYDCIAYIPFENVLVKNDRYKGYASSAQKEADLTYIILYGIDILTKRVEDLIYYASISYRDLLHNEVYSKPVEEKREPTPSQIEKVDIFEAPKEEIKQEDAPKDEPTPFLEPEPVEEDDDDMETIQEPIVNNHYQYNPSSWDTSFIYSQPSKEETKPAPEPKPEEEAKPEPVKEEPHIETAQEKWNRLLKEKWPNQNAPKEEAKPEPQRNEQMSLFDEIEEEPAPEIKEEPETLIEETKEEKKVVEAKPYVAPTREEKEVPLIDKIPEPSENSNAWSMKAPSISDKEVKAYAKYLMEINPSLRKAQALFYASHSQMGRYYTIQDYKKAMKVVYETARTSMDHLADEGFYQKLQIKNKFVYTPIKQGETK